jgi:hypothetical protein
MADIARALRRLFYLASIPTGESRGGPKQRTGESANAQLPLHPQQREVGFN